MTAMDRELDNLAEVQALPHRSVVKDARNRLFQVRHHEGGTREFVMFGDSVSYRMNGADRIEPFAFEFPVSVLWYGAEVLLPIAPENVDANWVN